MVKFTVVRYPSQHENIWLQVNREPVGEGEYQVLYADENIDKVIARRKELEGKCEGGFTYSISVLPLEQGVEPYHD